MSTPDEAREELAALLRQRSIWHGGATYEEDADAILAAGYRKLGPVTEEEITQAGRHLGMGDGMGHWIDRDAVGAALEASRSVLGNPQHGTTNQNRRTS